MLGTVRLNNHDSQKRHKVKKSIALLKDALHRTWYLCIALPRDKPQRRGHRVTDFERQLHRYADFSCGNPPYPPLSSSPEKRQCDVCAFIVGLTRKYRPTLVEAPTLWIVYYLSRDGVDNIFTLLLDTSMQNTYHTHCIEQFGIDQNRAYHIPIRVQAEYCENTLRVIFC